MVHDQITHASRFRCFCFKATLGRIHSHSWIDDDTQFDVVPCRVVDKLMPNAH